MEICSVCTSIPETVSRSAREIPREDPVAGGGATRKVTSVRGVLESEVNSTLEGRIGGGSAHPPRIRLKTISVWKTR
jgi:hypothetical protein